MVWPLGAWRILRLVQSLRQTPADRRLRQAALAFYALLAVAQLAALITTESRGPFFGWLTSVAIWCILLGLRRRQRLLAVAPIAAFALLLGFLAVLKVPNGPLRNLRYLVFDRFSETLSPQEGTGSFRTLTWQRAFLAVIIMVFFCTYGWLGWLPSRWHYIQCGLVLLASVSVVAIGLSAWLGGGLPRSACKSGWWPAWQPIR